MFTLYDVEVSADTTFTATYSTSSDSIVVEFCDFVDYAVTGKKTNWYNYSNRLSVATDENGTTLSKGTNNGYYFVQINNEYFLFTDFIVEFDIVSCTNQTIWYIQGQTNGTQDVINLAYHFSSGGHCRIVCDDGVIKVYKNNTQIGSDVTVTPVGLLEIGFRINSSPTETRNIKYKNFRLHEL